MNTTNISRLKALLDNLVERGIAYVVALNACFAPEVYCTSIEDCRDTIVNALRLALGDDLANKMYSEISQALKAEGLDNFRTKIKVGDKEISVEDFIRSYLLEERVLKLALEEIKNIISQISENEKKALVLASAVIFSLLNRDQYPLLRVYKNNEGYIVVHSLVEEFFSQIVSSILGVNINIRDLFCKYLLGFTHDRLVDLSTIPPSMISEAPPDEFMLVIYPFAVEYLKQLASEASKYIYIPNKFDVMSKLKELYTKEEYLKLGIIHEIILSRDIDELEELLEALVYYSEYVEAEELNDYLVLRSDELFVLEKLCDELYNDAREIVVKITVMGWNRCCINPLVYDHVKESIESLYNEALSKLVEQFRTIFEKAGYSARCINELCILTRGESKPIYIWLSPWPTTFEKIGEYYRDKEALEGSPIAIVQGTPSRTIFKMMKKRIVEKLGDSLIGRITPFEKHIKGYIESLLFLKNNDMFSSRDIYDRYKELFTILGKHFSIKFI